MFRIGQKVVCISSPTPQWYIPNVPVVDEIYVIRGIRTEAHIEGYGVLLDRVINQEILWDDGDTCEWGFRPRHFRPLVETDISVFEEMLREKETT
jgi:hypothetical protein